jgi:uncharacterized lipoprotein YddW (UPF0748 family)
MAEPKEDLMTRSLLGLLVCLTLAPLMPSTQAATPQLRAFWVDAFHDGFKTPVQTQRLVEEAHRAGANALFVQVRRRADSYYRKTLEPIASDLQSGYDPLADLITRAHARNIEVHAWTVVLPAWGDGYNQPDQSHVWYQHGPSKPGANNWFMLSDTGQAANCEAGACAYFLDPGHPAVVDYTVKVLMHLVQQYDLDGLHLDYTRYPSPRFGYNPVSLARFQRAAGRSDRPAWNDAQWMQWRRDQVTNLVKRIYLNLHAVKPAMVLSAAAITLGAAPTTDFKTSEAYQRTLQDWAGWLERGYVDLAIPMTYYRESTSSTLFTNWVNFTRTHKGRREVAIGIGAWLNTADENFAQISRSINGTLGVTLYSYANPVANPTPDNRSNFLTRLGALWRDGARAPELPWLTNPTKGHLLGRSILEGSAADNLKVDLYAGSVLILSTYTDANGVFGAVDLNPGRYMVSMQDPRDRSKRVTAEVEVRAGQVSWVLLPQELLQWKIWMPMLNK